MDGREGEEGRKEGREGGKKEGKKEEVCVCICKYIYIWGLLYVNLIMGQILWEDSKANSGLEVYRRKNQV